MSQPFHIAFCVDGNYFRAMAATVSSILERNANQPFVFHIFTFDLDRDIADRLRLMDKPPLVTTELHIVDQNRLNEFRGYFGSSHYSPAIFLRLLIPSFLKGKIDRVLYLDADILCFGSLNSLIELESFDEIAAVVLDAPETVRRRCKALDIDSGKYFNSGVMLLNVEAWLSEGITDRTLRELSVGRKDMRFPDQDALNLALHGRVKFLEKRFNYLYDLIHDLNIQRLNLRPLGDAVLVHFAGSVKPWSLWTGHSVCQLFKQFLSLSPWSGTELDVIPTNSKEMRMHSRFLFRRGELLKSLYWYFEYLKVKAMKYVKLAGV